MMISRPRLRLALLHASMLVAPALLAGPAFAQGLAPNAAPQGGHVVGGAASIGQTAAATTITQSTNRAVIDWRSFDVGRDHTVQFRQPSAQSMTMNRVTGPNPSVIAGRITANGGIALVNQSGVMFTGGAQVQAQSVIVSTNDIGNDSFMRGGAMVFDRPGKPGARIENRGTITAAQAGIAALVAPQVANSGVIAAKLGTVVLAGASQQVIDLNGDGLVSFAVGAPVRRAPADGKALVTNTGTLAADGGTVLLTARAADQVVQNLVRAGGTIHADSIGGRAGRVVMSGAGGSIIVEGGVSAAGRAPGTRGGSVTVQADRVLVAGTARVDASGQAGGGRVAIGVDGPRLAARTGIAAGAVLRADATARGTGGRVVVNSRQVTAMDGRISARGGPQGGDGGVVEVSSGGSFRLTGSIDVGAAAGALGTVIFDPDTLTIVADGDSRINTGASDISDLILGFGDTPADAFMSAAVVGGVTGNLVLQANNTLTVESAITKTAGDLALESGGVLTIAAPVVLSAGDLTLYGTNIAINERVQVSSANQVILSSGSFSSTSSVIESGAGLIAAGTLTQDPDVSFGTITLGGANLVDEIVGLSSFGVVTFNNQQGLLISGSLYGSDGVSIDVRGGDLTVATNVNSNGDVALRASGGITLTSAGQIDGTDIELAAGFDFTAGTADIAAAGGIILAGPVEAAYDGGYGTITLAAGTAGISQTGSALVADTLLVQSGGNAVLNSALPWDGYYASYSSNRIITLGPSHVVGNFSLDAYNLNFYQVYDPSLDIALSGAISVSGTLALRGEQAGFVQGAGSVLTVGGLAATAVDFGDLTFGGDNQITRLAALSGAGITVRNISDLIVGGPVASTAGLAIAVAAGDLTVNGTVSASDAALTLQASGNINVAAGSTIVATNTLADADITLSAATPDGGYSATQPGSIGLGGVILAPDTLALKAGTGGIVQSGGQITAWLLAVGSGGQALLAGAPDGNAVAMLLGVNATGDFVLDNGTADLAVGGAVTAAGIRLRTTGALALGRYCPPILASGCTAPPATLDAGSGIVALEAGTTLAFTLPGNQATGGTIEIAPSLSETLLVGAAAGTTVPGSLSVNQDVLGALTATTLTLGGTTASGTSASTLQLVDALSFAGTLDLRSLGDISQSAPITVGTLTGLAGGSIGLANNANSVGTVGDLGAGGDLALTVTGTMTLAGLLQAVAGTADLIGPAGIIETGAGRIIAATLLAQSAGDITLGGANGVTILGSSSAGGNFTLVDGVGLTVASGDVVSATGTLALTTTGSLTIGGQLDAASVALVASTGIALTGPGLIITPLLSAITTTGDIALIANNQIDALGAIQTPGRFLLVDEVGALTVGAGTVVRGDSGIVLQATGSLVLDGTLRATGTTVDIVGVASLAEGLGGSIEAGLLKVIGTTGGIALIGANQVGQLGASSANGDFVLNNTVDLTVPAGNTVFASGTLALAGSGTLGLEGTLNGAVVSVSGANGISQVGGAIITPLLEAVSSGGAVALNGANQVDALGTSSAFGDFALNNTLALLVPAGATVTAGGTLSLLSGGALTLAGQLNGASVTLVGDTGIGETGAGAIAAGSLAVSTTTGDILLGGANTVDVLDSVTTPGRLVFNDVAATVSVPAGHLIGAQGGITLTATGALALNGLLVADGATVDITAGSVSQAAAGGITSAVLTARATAGDLLLGGPNSVDTLGAMTATGDLTFNNLLALSVGAGDTILAGGTLTLTTAQSLTVTGPLSAVSMVLGAGTGISETGAGAVTTPLLAASTSTGDIILTGANSVDALDTVSTPGSFRFTDGADVLTVGTGHVVSAASGITLGLTGALSLDGTLAAPGATVDIGATGIGQGTGGVILAGLLTARASDGAMLLTGPNRVDRLGDASAAGDLVLNNALALTVPADATVQADGTLGLASGATLNLRGLLIAPTVNLSGASGIGQSGGAIQTAMLTANSSAGDVALGGANLVDALGASSAGGSFLLNDTTALTIDAGQLVSAAGGITLASTGVLTLAGTLSAPTATVDLSAPDISQIPDSGIVNAGTLLARASAGDVALLGDNTIGVLGNASATGDFLLNTSGPLEVAAGATVSAGGQLVMVTDDQLTIAGQIGGDSVMLTAPSGIEETDSGVIITRVLSASSFDGSILLGGENQVAQSGILAAAGDLLLNDMVALDVPAGSTITAAGTLSVTTPGSLSLAGLIGGVSVVLSADAGIAESGAGAIVAGQLSAFSMAGDVMLGGANTIALLTDSGAGGDLLVNDTTTLVVPEDGLIATGGTLTLRSAGSLAIDGAIDGSSVVLSAANGISEGAGGVITAPLLSVTSTAGDILLGGANEVDQLLAGSASGQFVLNTTGALGIAGQVSGSGITLAAGGSITETGDGALFAPVLAASTTAGDIVLGGDNRVETLGAISVPGRFVLTDHAAGVAVAADATVGAGGGIALALDGALVIEGTLDAGSGAVDIASADITEKGGGRILAGLLTVRANGGDIVLNGANAVVLLGDIVTPGAFTLNNTIALTVPADAVVQAGGTALITGDGDIIVDGHVEGGTLVMQAAGLLQVNGFSAVATTGPLSLLGHRVETTGLFGSPAGTSIGADSASLGGRVSGPSLEVSAPDLVFTGLDAAGTRVTMFLGSAGTATGTLDAAGLVVAGGAGATLFGTVDGRTGGAAAALGVRADGEGIAFAPPPPDPDLFTLEGCPIAVSVCQPLTVAPPTAATAPGVIVAGLDPRDFDELLTEVALGLPTPTTLFLRTQPMRDPEDDVNLAPPNIRAEDF